MVLIGSRESPQPVFQRRTFVLTKAKCILSGRLRILVRGSALSTMKSGVNVCLDDNSHILRLDGGQKRRTVLGFGKCVSQIVNYGVT